MNTVKDTALKDQIKKEFKSIIQFCRVYAIPHNRVMAAISGSDELTRKIIEEKLAIINNSKGEVQENGLITPSEVSVVRKAIEKRGNLTELSRRAAVTINHAKHIASGSAKYRTPPACRIIEEAKKMTK